MNTALEEATGPAALPSNSAGATMSASSPARVVEHAPCRWCGYDLHNALREGGCPECGKPVAKSLDPRRLVLAGADWLTGVASALTRVLIGLAIGVAAFVVLVIFVAGYASDSWGPWWQMATWAFAMPPGLILSHALWKLTAPQPGRKRWSLDLTRVVARYAAMLTTVMALATGPAFLLGWALGGGWLAHALGLPIGGIGAIAVVVFGFFAMLYAFSLAWRARAWWLAAATVLLFLAYIVFAAGAAALGAAAVAAVLFGGATVVMPESIAGIFAALMLLFAIFTVFGAMAWFWVTFLMLLWTLIMTAWYRWMIGRVAAQARELHAG